MADTHLTILADRIRERFPDAVDRTTVALAELTIEVSCERLHDVCRTLRDDFGFEQLIDLCGVDYLSWGEGAWKGPRFAVVYHLLSIVHNERLRVRTFLDEDVPRVQSVVDIWASANWYEREAFDLYGFLFEGHPDLRRLLTDYGFIGHPFRKDFPLWGNVEMRYDPERQRVVYEPVVIEPRVTVPRVIPQDHRYLVEGSQREREGEAGRG